MDEEETKRKAEEEAKKSAEQGAAGNKPEGDQPKISTLHEQTDATIKRLEETNKKTEELLNRQEKLYENQKLSGEGGGRVESKVVSEEQKKVDSAADYFKGTQLEIDIKKANE